MTQGGRRIPRKASRGLGSIAFSYLKRFGNGGLTTIAHWSDAPIGGRKVLSTHLVEGISYSPNVAHHRGRPGFEQKFIRHLVEVAPTLGARCTRLSVGCGPVNRVRMARGGWIVREHSGHGKGFGVAESAIKKRWDGNIWICTLASWRRPGCRM